MADQTSDAMVLKPNPYFPFDDEFTKFDEVVLRYVPDSGEQLALLRAGEIDIALDLTAKQAELLKEPAEFSVYEDSTADLVLLAANLKHPGPCPKSRRTSGDSLCVGLPKHT